MAKEAEDKKEKRFIVKSADSLGELGMTLAKVVVDTQTGVNYLLIEGSGTAQHTCVVPLLDAKGKVLVDSLPIRE